MGSTYIICGLAAVGTLDEVIRFFTVEFPKTTISIAIGTLLATLATLFIIWCLKKIKKPREKLFYQLNSELNTANTKLEAAHEEASRKGQSQELRKHLKAFLSPCRDCRSAVKRCIDKLENMPRRNHKLENRLHKLHDKIRDYWERVSEHEEALNSKFTRNSEFYRSEEEYFCDIRSELLALMSDCTVSRSDKQTLTTST